MSARDAGIPAPLGLLAELTHRCPLACPYCSNPLTLDNRADELDAATWARVFQEAAGLGVLQVHLSGGEPASRRDLVEIVAAARDAGLYTNLITSAIGLDAARLARLKEVGLDHVQLSLQDVEADSADRIAGYPGAHTRKLAFAQTVVGLGLAFTVNTVIHRANIGRVAALVETAASLGAGRVEIAHTQYYGWALRNRHALMPTREQVDHAMREMETIRPRYHGRLVIDLVVPDYYARRPKACMGGWARRSLNVTPSGRVLPCHAAETIPGLRFWSVRDYPLAEIWREVAGVSGISRHRLDARALSLLRHARDRLRRVPLPGDGAHRRCSGDRSGVRTVAASRAHPGARRTGFGRGNRRLRVSWPRRAWPGYCHSSSLKAVVALRAL